MRMRTQFALAASLVLVVTLGVILGAIVPRWQTELEQGARQRGRAVIGLLAHVCAEPAMVGNYSELQRLVDVLGDEPGVVYVAVLDRRGRVQVSSAGDGGRAFFEIDALPVDPAGICEAGQARLVDARTRLRGVPVLDFVAPLRGHKRSWGAARLGLSLAPIEAATAAVAHRTGLLGLAGLAVAVCLVFLLIAGITRPLARLVQAADSISAGRLEVRVGIRGTRELFKLGQAFDSMAASIERQIREIEEKSSELEAGYRVLARLGSTIDREALMEGVLEVITDVLGARACELAALDARRGVVDRFAHGQAGYASAPLEPGTQAPPAGEDLIAHLKRIMQPGPGDLFIPLQVEGRGLGGMLARAAPGRAFSERQRKLAEAISHHILVALENARLYELAIRDGLTGLTIRRYFLARLEDELARAKRYGQPICLLMIDIDHFKRVNDSWGHPAGDRVLQSMAARLRGALRSSDLLSRYGGEEMVALLPEQGREQGRLVAEKLRAVVADEPFDLGEGNLQTVTISLGVAAFPADASGGPDLVARADQALYAAKQAGRNRVELASGTSSQSDPSVR
ncbi:MAG: diguanylate cyclase [Deltaproteobacteria bacterium]|nr:diguanylate cyclase [Deltaproteobacteria bacterium]